MTRTQGFWKCRENVRAYIECLAEKLGYTGFEDWYNFKQVYFIKNEGAGLIDLFGSYIDAIITSFPEYNWKRWLFTCVPKNYWDDFENRLSYFRWLENKLGYKDICDWYALDQSVFYKNKGGGLLQLVYNNSPILFLKEFMPDVDWLEWKFVSTPNGFWNDNNNVKRYMHWLKGILNFKSVEDWYELTCSDLVNNCGASLLSLYGSPAKLVMQFVDYDWDAKKFKYGLKDQKLLFDIVKSIFYGYKLEWNYSHKGMRFSDSNFPMQLDIFIPILNLAFEYQGKQHFFPVKLWGGKSGLEARMRRDNEKRLACKKNGIILIEIDYKWDRTREFVEKLLIDAGV